MPTPRFRSAATFIALTIVLAGCGDPAAEQARERQRLALADAEILGAEVYDVVDQVVGYRSAVGRNPKTLRQAGIDSLTPTTARWIDRSNDLAVTVAFRSRNGHALSQCRGTAMVLEDVALEGKMHLDCRWMDGKSVEMAVARVPQ